MHKLVNGIEVPLSEEEILDFKAREAEHEKALADKAKNQFLENRRDRKPGIREQLEMMEELGFEEWQTRMNSINAKFPKPE